MNMTPFHIFSFEISGIPCPPLSHPVLGHHDMILHPLKHELRAQVGDSTRSPIFQVGNSDCDYGRRFDAT